MIRFDCHAHVYESIAPVGIPRYVPETPAPLTDWLAQQERHGVLGGVIVQVSFLGTDNSELLAALSRLDRLRYAGIAVTGLDVSDTELSQLAEGNVRGLRWNLVAGAPVPDLASCRVRKLAERLQAFGMHLELQIESPRLAHLLPELTRLPVPVVIDHMGLPVSPCPANEPWLRALADTPHANIYVKLSAPYRAKHDPRPHIDRLMSLLPQNRFLWGSDWPHTRHEAAADYLGLWDDLEERIDDTAPASALYGIGTPLAPP